MYLGSRKPKRRDSPWRVLVLTVLVIGGLYMVREQLSGAGWTRPFDATPTPTRTSESYFDEAEVLYQEGLLDEAIVAYQNAFGADPEDNIALFRLVRLMIFRQRTDDGLVFKVFPDEPVTLAFMGGHKGYFCLHTGMQSPAL